MAHENKRVIKKLKRTIEGLNLLIHVHLNKQDVLTIRLLYFKTKIWNLNEF